MPPEVVELTSEQTIERPFPDEPIPTKTDILPYSFPGPNSKPHRTRSLTQLIDAAETVYQCLMGSLLLPQERAALVRALCDVDKRIRAWKGLPEPGQLRPDLPPMKGAKLRRAKAGQVLDISDVAQLMVETREAAGNQAQQVSDAGQQEVNATASETRETPTAHATPTPAKKRNPFEKLKRERAAQTKPTKE